MRSGRKSVTSKTRCSDDQRRVRVALRGVLVGHGRDVDYLVARVRHAHRFDELYDIHALGKDYRCRCGATKTVWKGLKIPISGHLDLAVRPPPEERAGSGHREMYYTATGFAPKKKRR